MNLSRSGGTIFREVQRFRYSHTWMAIAALFTVSAAGLAWVLLVRTGAVEARPDLHLETSRLEVSLAVLTVMVGAAFLLLHVARLTTEVREDGLYVRFYPFHSVFQKIPLDQVRSFQATTYRPIRDYGGYGIRYGWRSKAYNVSGNRGVKVEYAGGRTLLIGSQKAEQLAQALASILKPPR